MARDRSGGQFDPALVEAAAGELGLAADDAVTLRRAALVHDVGRTGIPNTTWDKRGALTSGERERARLYPYYTERVLARSAALAALRRSRPPTASGSTAPATTAAPRDRRCRRRRASWRRPTATAR